MAYNTTDYNCADDGCASLPDYNETIETCGAVGRLGGASTLYLLFCGYGINDPGDTAEWDALVTAGKAARLSNIKLGMAAPSAIESDPTTSCGTKKIINYTRTAQVEDFKVTPDNTYFYSQAKKRDFEGAAFVECTTSGLTALVTFIDADISLAAYRDLPNTNENLQKYVVEISWKDIDDPLQYNFS
jgi:hypothetical protein